MRAIDAINAKLSELGMSGAELTRLIGVSNGVYSQWNTGKTNPSNASIAKIAKALGCTVEELLKPTQTVPPVDTSVEPTADDMMALLQAYRENPELRVLFHASKKATADDLLLAADFIRRRRANDEAD